MPEEVWKEVPNIVQEAVSKTIPKKKKYKAKYLSEEEEKQKAREKGHYIPSVKFQRIAER